MQKKIRHLILCLIFFSSRAVSNLNVDASCWRTVLGWGQNVIIADSQDFARAVSFKV